MTVAKGWMSKIAQTLVKVRGIKIMLQSLLDQNMPMVKTHDIWFDSGYWFDVIGSK